MGDANEKRKTEVSYKTLPCVERKTRGKKEYCSHWYACGLLKYCVRASEEEEEEEDEMNEERRQPTTGKQQTAITTSVRDLVSSDASEKVMRNSRAREQRERERKSTSKISEMIMLEK